MNCNDNYKNALNKIKSPECCRKNCFLLGPTWPTGPTGPQGDTGGILDYTDFYALMPPDKAATVAPGTDVEFPEIVTYQVLFQVSVNEAGQLILTLNGNDLKYSAVGRSTGTDQIIGLALVTTTSVNSNLTYNNSSHSIICLFKKNCWYVHTFIVKIKNIQIRIFFFYPITCPPLLWITWPVI